MSGDRDIGKILLDRGLITRAEYDLALQIQKDSGRPLDEILVDKSFVSRGQMEEAVDSSVKRGLFCRTCDTTVFVRAGQERCPDCRTPIVRTGEATVREDEMDVLDEDLPAEVRVARQALSRRFGKYVLLHELGRGGTGVVHKAWDTMLGDYVALKFLREPNESSAAVRKRERAEMVKELLQEARALRMRHDHILPILDVGRVGRQVYLSMEYIEGRSLSGHIMDARRAGRISPLYDDPVFYLTVFRDVCAAVQYAHTFRRPLVHCDLKPGNVLISKGGTAYVMDFGLARALDLPPERDSVIRGTPAYMAPEQLSGRTQDIGVWTDVYGLGGILYELLTGRAVFTGDTSKVMGRSPVDRPKRPAEFLAATEDMKREDAPAILALVERIERICMRALSPSTRERQDSARTLEAEIDLVLVEVQKGHEASVPDEVRAERERSETRRRMREEQADTASSKEHRADTDVMPAQGGVELTPRFRQRLADRVNERRPRFPDFRLAAKTLQDAELLKATAEQVAVSSGSELMLVGWSDIEPAQIVVLAEGLRLEEPEDLLAIGIFCYHTHQFDQARALLGRLTGTPLERTASQILRWMK